MASKVFLSAVELGVFTELAGGPLDRENLREWLLHPRAARDFFDTLVALGVLERTGDQYATRRRAAFTWTRAIYVYRRSERDDGRSPVSILGIADGRAKDRPSAESAK